MISPEHSVKNIWS